MHNLLHFQGKFYPINDKRDIIQGLKTYPTMVDVPEELVSLADLLGETQDLSNFFPDETADSSPLSSE
jgi:hypothetical protein